MGSELDVGDVVIIDSDPKDAWVIASMDKSDGTVQVRRGDMVRKVRLSSIRLARTHNRPTDTPVRHRRVTEF